MRRIDKNTKRKAIIIWLLIIVALFYSLLSCSPAKRLNRLQDKHPYLFEKKMDTITVHDTTEIMIPGVKFDSSFQLFQMSTPGGINFSKEHFNLHLFHDTITNYVTVDANVDTVYKPVYTTLKVPYNRYIVEPAKNQFIKVIKAIFWLILLIATLLFVINFFKKRK